MKTFFIAISLAVLICFSARAGDDGRPEDSVLLERDQANDGGRPYWPIYAKKMTEIAISPPAGPGTHKLSIKSYSWVQCWKDGSHITADGDGPGEDRCVAPKLRLHSLIVKFKRYIKQPGGSTSVIQTDWMQAGESSVVECPYGPNEHAVIILLCNDHSDGFWDNSGWWHVTFDWIK